MFEIALRQKIKEVNRLQPNYKPALKMVCRNNCMFVFVTIAAARNISLRNSHLKRKVNMAKPT